MPELPEVEVVRRGLAAHVVGRTLTGVDVRHPRAVRRHSGGPADFSARLRGRVVLGVHRRGKFLWLALDDGSALLCHLGMSGQLLVRDEASGHQHLRVDFVLDGGPRHLEFVDQRTFGGMLVCDLDHDVPPEIAHIARDPLDPEFDDDAFHSRLRRRNSGIKRALLDQMLISGVGNIYADEALWRTSLHFDRSARRLRRPVVDDLLRNIRAVMAEALAEGGTSFDSLYVNVNGQSGYFSRSLDAYGREGEACRRCGASMVREPFMNRSSYRCPHCQPCPPKPRNPR